MERHQVMWTIRIRLLCCAPQKIASMQISAPQFNNPDSREVLVGRFLKTNTLKRFFWNSE